MLVVPDTDILVSALRSPFGAPARVLDMVLGGEIRADYDDRVMAGYRQVSARPQFGFAPQDAAAMLAYLEADGLPVTARPLACRLPDPDDLPFLEVAAGAKAVLITGNTSPYPRAVRGKVRVVSLSDFFGILRK